MAIRRKARKRERLVWPLVAAGSAVVAGAATRAALRGGYKAVRGRTLPADPARRDLPWGRALIWAVGTGALAASARLLAERGAAAGWTRVLGSRPPKR